MRWTVLVLASFVSVLALEVPRAQACSGPGDYRLDAVVPATGATGVPTNVQARVVHGGTSREAELGDLILRPVGGDPVPATVTRLDNNGVGWHQVFVVKPDAPLASATSYELAGKIKPDCTRDCVSPTYVVLSTFTTGAGPDVTPPTFGGISDVVVHDFYECKGVGSVGAPVFCCGTQRGHELSVKWDAAQDDSGIAGYVIEQDGERVSSYGAFGLGSCGGMYSGGPIYDFFGSSGEYTVHAVDLAGNVDTNSAVRRVVLPCKLAPSDAGVPDAATPATATETEAGAGCAVSGRAPAGGGLILLLALGALARRRR